MNSKRTWRKTLEKKIEKWLYLLTTAGVSPIRRCARTYLKQNVISPKNVRNQMDSEQTLSFILLRFTGIDFSERKTPADSFPQTPETD